MGFETFRVELRGGSASYREADEAVRVLPHAEPDQDSVPTQGSRFYLIHGVKHAIELELMDAPVKLSCRFTLCHPPTIDAVFLDLVKELMDRLGMEARICDDLRPEHARPYSLEEFTEFSAIASKYIAARRTEWITAFGGEPLAATTNDVYQRIILPRCHAGVEQPT